MDIDIGSKIRSLRKSKGMNIATLAEKAQVSTGTISQIERNLVVPTVVALWKIATALDVKVGYFFDEEEKALPDPVVRKGDRKRIATGNSKGLYEMLMPDMKRKLEVLLITYKDQNDSSTDFVTHEGEECGYVIKGTLKVVMEDRSYTLEEGDSIYYDSTIPHRYENVGDGECISVWAMTPPSF